MMQAVTISLQPEYRAEFLDPLHRHMELSKKLYDLWEIDRKDSATDLDFPAWIEAKHNTTKYKCDIVSYIPNTELTSFKVTFAYGEAINSGLKLTCEIDNRKRYRPIALIIMPNNELYAATMNTAINEKYRVQHSSLSSGGGVYFAAEAYAKDGMFIRITDKSGHYKPNLRSFVYGLRLMRLAGANFSLTRIEVNSYDENKLRTFDLGDEFINRYDNLGFNAATFTGTFKNIADAIVSFNDQDLTYQPKAIYFILEHNDLFEITKKNNKITYSSFFDLVKLNEENYEQTLEARKAQQQILIQQAQAAAQALAAQDANLPQLRINKEQRINEEKEANLKELLALPAQQNGVNRNLCDSPPPQDLKRFRRG